MPKVSFRPKLEDFTSLSFDMICIYVIECYHSLTLNGCACTLDGVKMLHTNGWTEKAILGVGCGK